MLKAHVRISLLFQRGRATPSTHLVRDIIVCRKTKDLRKAAILLLEAACRPPPTILLLEVVRAPPHTEDPPRMENPPPPRDDRGVADPRVVDATVVPAPPQADGGSPTPGLVTTAGPQGPANASPGASAGAGGAMDTDPDLPSSLPPLSLLLGTVPAFRRPFPRRHLLAAHGRRGRPTAQQRVWAAHLCHRLRTSGGETPKLMGRQ